MKNKEKEEVIKGREGGRSTIGKKREGSRAKVHPREDLDKQCLLYWVRDGLCNGDSIFFIEGEYMVNHARGRTSSLSF